MFDFLLRRGNPTNAWTRRSGLTLSVDLSIPAVNNVPIGSKTEEYSFLGRTSSNKNTPLGYSDLGFSLDNEDEGYCSGFEIIFVDTRENYESFSGKLMVNGEAATRLNFLKKLGEPYWVDRDDDEVIYFFEYPTYEIQVEQSLEGENQRIIVTSRPLMANPAQRKSYGVDKQWPPY